MERKLGGFLLTALGIIGLILAYVNLLEIITNQSYGNNLYNVGDKGSSAVGVMGYGLAGLVLTFLGIKTLRGRTTM
jgi:hypothetical protein